MASGIGQAVDYGKGRGGGFGKEAVVKGSERIIGDVLEAERFDETLSLRVLSRLLIERDLDDLDAVTIGFDSRGDLTGRRLAGVSPPIEPFEVKNLSGECVEGKGITGSEPDQFDF